MIRTQSSPATTRYHQPGSLEQPHWLRYGRLAGNALALIAAALLLYGLAWTYSTHRYLKGFSDAIVPLKGTPQQKTEALLGWMRHLPPRADDVIQGAASLRDPVTIVQNESLLKVCGSASNAFLNLADVAGLKARRLLLLQHSGGTNHVVAEVWWDDRWIVVDPQHGQVFTDSSGRALTKEELARVDVFQDAISRIPGYSPDYTFQRTAHLHLRRVPGFGALLRPVLDRVWPQWEEAFDWGYVPENPSLWPAFAAVPLLLLAMLILLIVNRRSRPRRQRESMTVDEIANAVSAGQ